MSETNNSKNGVFGQINVGENNIGENSSYFEGNAQNNFQNSNVGNVEQEIGTQNNNSGVFGTYGVKNDSKNEGAQSKESTMFKPIGKEKAITKQGLWSKIKAFLFQEIDLTAPIKVELTPYQQKVEDEINEFLHQEVSFKGIFNAFKGKNNKK